MKCLEKLYKKENYIIQKSFNIEDKLYTKLKKIVKTRFDASISETINVCIEEYIEEFGNSDKIIYYGKPAGEIMIYCSMMIRKENFEKLKNIKEKTGISVTRLINISIKEFLEKYSVDKK